MKNVNRCGLCVIDPKRKKIIVLKRKCPYIKNTQTPNTTTTTAAGTTITTISQVTPQKSKRKPPFVEQFCIPRGCQNTYESSFSCGIREFIEECGFFFNSFYKLSQTFDLEWEDPKDVTWRYKISFLCVDVESIFIPLQEKILDLVDFVSKQCQDATENYITFDSTQFQPPPDDDVPQPFSIKEKVRQNLNQSIIPIYSKNFKRLQKREFIQPSIMDIEKYFELMQTQKKLYIKNNYSSFLQFIGNQLSSLSSALAFQ